MLLCCMVQISTYLKVISNARDSGKSETANRMSARLGRLAEKRGYAGIADAVMSEHPDMPKLTQGLQGEAERFVRKMGAFSPSPVAPVIGGGWGRLPIQGAIIGGVIAAGVLLASQASKKSGRKWTARVQNDDRSRSQETIR